MERPNYTREKAEQLLKERFGLDHFKDSQWQGISQVLQGKKVLMIQPTGFGKSLCFQFPATVFDGITLVISPLIALMKDQVKKLKKRGINAEYLNTSIEDENERNRILKDSIDGKIKILYIAPERMENDAWQNAMDKMKISFVVIDEAHCISSWGHVFRPSYRRIISLVKLLPDGCPVLAVTATANARTQKDIEDQMKKRPDDEIITIRGDLTRENIGLRVSTVENDNQLYLSLAQFLQKAPGSGIIYAGSTSRTEIIANWLNYVGIPSINFYGRMDSEEKNTILEDLMSDKWKCIVSTSALGMGIDKPDVAFIIHTQIPESPIHYYQEVGRAGRNGMPSQALLLYNTELNPDGISEGMSMSYSFVLNARPEIKKYEEVINSLKENRNTVKRLSSDLDIDENSINTIKEDLVDQKIIRCLWDVQVKETKFYYLSEKIIAVDYIEYLSKEQISSLKLCLLNGKMSEYNLCIKTKISKRELNHLNEDGYLQSEVECKKLDLNFWNIFQDLLNFQQ